MPLSAKAKALGDQPAFEPPIQRQHHEGLSKREYFAALAMQGLVATPRPAGPTIISGWAIEQADALLEALAKEDA